MTEIVRTEQSQPVESHQPPTPEPPRERFLGADDIFRRCGTLDVDDATMAILMAPVDETQICMRPDGIVYLPWVFYADRLRKAFGVSWSLVAGDKPTLEGNQVIWLHHLIVRGCYVSSSYGQCNYHANNRGMTYGDAIEGAKSDALTRCCKPLGISAELWDPNFVRHWKDKWGESNGRKWRKKEAGEMGWEEKFLNRIEEPASQEVRGPVTSPETIKPPPIVGGEIIEVGDGGTSWIEQRIRSDFSGWFTICEKKGHDEHADVTWSVASRCETCRGILRWALDCTDGLDTETLRTRAGKVVEYIEDERKEVQKIKQLIKKCMADNGIKRPQWKDAIYQATAGKASSFPDLNKWPLDAAKDLLLIFEATGEALAEELADNGNKPDPT